MLKYPENRHHTKDEINGFFAEFAAKKVLAAQDRSYKVIPYPDERVIVTRSIDGTVTRAYFSYATLSNEEIPQTSVLPNEGVQDPLDENILHFFSHSASLTFKKTGLIYQLRTASQFGEGLYQSDGNASQVVMEDRLSFPDSNQLGAFNFNFRRGVSNNLYGSFDIDGKLMGFHFNNGKNNKLDVHEESLKGILKGNVINTARWVNSSQNTRQEYLVGAAKGSVLIRRSEEGYLLDVIILPQVVNDRLISMDLLSRELAFDPAGKHPDADEQWLQQILAHQIEGFKWNRIPPQLFASIIRILP